ncbi:hypothetical protein [Limoniibacter endophyticus]|nr:hypothetical protein [Limoniibacter endophyticus]
MKFRTTATLAVLMAVIAVTACGRKNAPITPYEAGMEARRQAEKNNEPLPPEPKKPVADRPFILDKLI